MQYYINILNVISFKKIVDDGTLTIISKKAFLEFFCTFYKRTWNPRQLHTIPRLTEFDFQILSVFAPKLKTKQYSNKMYIIHSPGKLRMCMYTCILVCSFSGQIEHASIGYFIQWLSGQNQSPSHTVLQNYSK